MCPRIVTLGVKELEKEVEEVQDPVHSTGEGPFPVVEEDVPLSHSSDLHKSLFLSKVKQEYPRSTGPPEVKRKEVQVESKG